MLLITCPYCREARPETDFSYAGEAHISRPTEPDKLNHAEWAEYLFMRSNARGTHYERWRHSSGCGRFFNAVRDTVSDRFIETYEMGKPRLKQRTGS